MTDILLLVVVLAIVGLVVYVIVLNNKLKFSRGFYTQDKKALEEAVAQKVERIKDLSLEIDAAKIKKIDNDKLLSSMQTELYSMQNKFVDLQNNYDKLLNQKKSSEVKLGKTAENHAPFFHEWPYDARKFRFLGDPVDGVQFNEDEVIFVEIKTGKSRLSPSQKNIKALVKEGKVKFGEFRIDEAGCEFKLDN